MALELSDERIFELAHTIKQQAEAVGDAEALFQSRLLLGKHYLEKQKYADAVALLESLLVSSLSSEQRMEVLMSLIEACEVSDEINKVLTYAPEALSHFTEHEQQNLAKQATLHEVLGNSYCKLYAFQEAFEHYLKSLSLYQTLGQPQGIGETYISIGWTYCVMENYGKAKEFFLLAKDIATSIHDVMLGARAIGNLANVYSILKDFHTSIKYHQQAIETFQRIDSPGRVAVGYCNVGTDYFHLENVEEAFVYFRKALAQLELHPNKGVETRAYVHMGEALIETDSQQAEGYLHKALGMMKETGSTEYLSYTHKRLARLYEKQGKLSEALEHYKTYADLEIEQLRDMNEKRTQAIAVQLDVSKLEHERESYKQKMVELSSTIEHLAELSVRDGLTGLYNRRYFDEQLAQIFLESQSNHQPFTVLMSDIDNFKKVNDNFSHSVGDDVLKIVAKIFADNIWGGDMVARYGGEEFVAVFRHTSLEKAIGVAEKLRQKVAHYPWHTIHPNLTITISLGLCDDLSLGDCEKMVAMADENLYIAKRNGKNQVVG